MGVGGGGDGPTAPHAALRGGQLCCTALYPLWAHRAEPWACRGGLWAQPLHAGGRRAERGAGRGKKKATSAARNAPSVFSVLWVLLPLRCAELRAAVVPLCYGGREGGGLHRTPSSDCDPTDGPQLHERGFTPSHRVGVLETADPMGLSCTAGAPPAPPDPPLHSNEALMKQCFVKGPIIPPPPSSGVKLCPPHPQPRKEPLCPALCLYFCPSFAEKWSIMGGVGGRWGWGGGVEPRGGAQTGP